jgi:hypothetical protein
MVPHHNHQNHNGLATQIVGCLTNTASSIYHKKTEVQQIGIQNSNSTYIRSYQLTHPNSKLKG